MRLTAGRVTATLLAAAALTAACSTGLSEQPRTAQDRGRQHLVTYGCTSCHQVPGVPVPQGRVGPPLGGFGDRRVVAGLLPNNPENAVRWIRDPQDVNPATVMPDLGVSEQEARDIVAYLYGLRERDGDDGTTGSDVDQESRPGGG